MDGLYQLIGKSTCSLRATATLQLRLSLLLATLAVCGGCVSTVPASMYCWEPAVIHDTAGKTIAVAKISGPAETALELEKAFIQYRPELGGHLPRVLDQASLQRYSTIQLVAANQAEASDMAVVHAARQQQIDFLLNGEVLESRGALGGDEALSISWRLLDVNGNQLLGGQPMTVTGEVIQAKYPELAEHLDRRAALIAAAARESWTLLTPHIRSVPIPLAKPRFSRGAAKVVEGNELAQQGNWEAAEQVWSKAIAEYPSQHAAVHNLALAHAARQDLVTAKKLAQQALQMRDCELYRRTTVWIESRQLSLASAFDLPPPDEGWLFSPDLQAGRESKLD